MDKSIKIFVPASSANLGAGFDVVGACLDIWNEIKIKEEKFSIDIEGYGSKSISKNKDNLIYNSYLKTSEIHGFKEKEISIKCNNSIPISGGLGSSSSAVIAGIYAAYAINKIEINTDDIFQIASDIESHPDNVGPAIFGGITIGFNDLEKWFISSVSYNKNLKFISFVSDQKVYNISRASLLINSLSSNNFDLLKYAFQDKLHEQYRTPSIKGYQTISNAAMNAGAISTYLSGSGPTISAVSLNKEVTINYEMLDAANKLGLEGKGFISSISGKGAYIVE